MCGEPTGAYRGPLTLDILGLAEAADLRAEWEALLDGAECPSPYLSLDWLAAWSHGFGGGPLRFHLARSEGRIAAAVPLVHGRRTLVGLPTRALYSPSLNNAFSDILVAGGQVAVDALLDGVLSSTRAHILLLRGVRRGSRQEACLRAYVAARRLAWTAAPTHEICIDTSGGLEAYRAGRRKKFWSNVRNRRRRLEALGRVEFERHRSSRDPVGLLEEACAISMRSWKFREGTALALLDRYRRFLGRLLASPIADTWVMRLDGRAIAFRILAVTRGVAAEVEIGYDEEYRALSPGTLLSAESNETLVREGAREISSAGDHAWKEEWSPERRERLEIVIFLPGRYARLLARMHGRRVRAAGGEAAPSLTSQRRS